MTGIRSILKVPPNRGHLRPEHTRPAPSIPAAGNDDVLILLAIAVYTAITVNGGPALAATAGCPHRAGMLLREIHVSRVRPVHWDLTTSRLRPERSRPGQRKTGAASGGGGLAGHHGDVIAALARALTLIILAARRADARYRTATRLARFAFAPGGSAVPEPADPLLTRARMTTYSGDDRVGDTTSSPRLSALRATRRDLSVTTSPRHPAALDRGGNHGRASDSQAAAATVLQLPVRGGDYAHAGRARQFKRQPMVREQVTRVRHCYRQAVAPGSPRGCHVRTSTAVAHRPRPATQSSSLR